MVALLGRGSVFGPSEDHLLGAGLLDALLLRRGVPIDLLMRLIIPPPKLVLELLRRRDGDGDMVSLKY